MDGGVVWEGFGRSDFQPLRYVLVTVNRARKECLGAAVKHSEVVIEEKMESISKISSLLETGNQSSSHHTKVIRLRPSQHETSQSKQLPLRALPEASVSNHHGMCHLPS